MCLNYKIKQISLIKLLMIYICSMDKHYEDFVNSIKEQVKAKRKLANISVKELAEKMNCSTSYINMVESGKQSFSLKKLFEFAKSMDLEIDITFKKRKNKS